MNCLPPERLQAAVQRWLEADEDVARGTRWYTREQWQAKGETLCADAPLTLLIEESELCQLLNGYWQGPDAEAVYADFEDLLTCHGYHWELGFTWSLHFYPGEVGAPQGKPDPVGRNCEVPF